MGRLKVARKDFRQRERCFRQGILSEDRKRERGQLQRFGCRQSK